MPGPNLPSISRADRVPERCTTNRNRRTIPAEFDNFDSAVATIEQDTQPNEANEWTGPRCEKCEAPLKSDVVTICRKCGWYASLGTFVEVDPNWETEDETGYSGCPGAAEIAFARLARSHAEMELDNYRHRFGRRRRKHCRAPGDAGRKQHPHDLVTFAVNVRRC